MKKKVKIDPDWSPITDIKRKGKVGCIIGNITLITDKETYHKYRNILINVLDVRGCLFKPKKKKK